MGKPLFVFSGVLPRLKDKLMFQYTLRRLAEAIPVILIIVSLTFFMVRLAPGGPFDTEKTISPQVKAALDARYGLDQPMYAQYMRFLSGLVQGDLGPSFKYPGWSVNELIADKLPISLELGLYGLSIAAIIGISCGTIAAIRRNTIFDYGIMGFCLLGICLPAFVIGPLLILIFGLNLDWVNVSGWMLPRDRILPAITLGLAYAAYIGRLTRGSMLEVLNQDYIRTARAKGMRPSRVYGVHALKNAILPVIAFLGPAAAGLISGSFVVETVFSIPGLGQFFVMSALNRDYTLVMGTVILYAILIITLNLIADLTQAYLNPKQKLSG